MKENPMPAFSLARYSLHSKPSFDGANVLLYLGSFVVLFSSYGLFAAVAASHGNGAAFGWSLLYLVALAALVVGFYAGAQPVSAGLLAFVFAAFTPVWMVTLERWDGYWHSGHGVLHTSVQGSWLLVELVTVAVSLLAVILTRFPLAGLVLAVSLWYTLVDNSTGIFLNSSSSNNAKAGVALIIGLLLMGVAVFLDETAYRLPSFWLHLIGLTSFAAGSVYVWHDTDSGWVGIILLSLLAIAVSAAIARAAYGVFGAVGLLYGAVHFVNEWVTSGFHTSLNGASHSNDWKPWLLYALVGFGLMIVGLIAANSESWRKPGGLFATAAAVEPMPVAETKPGAENPPPPTDEADEPPPPLGSA
jgi:hypothetical protein